MTRQNPPLLSRRQFVTGLAVSGLALGMGSRLATAAVSQRPPQVLRGNRFDLTIGYQPVNITGKERIAIAINGSVPAPTLRWKEGERVTLRVTNQLAEDSSIHWHGLILPANMDGVPGISFPGIRPGESFEYTFDVAQSGTYWYHSHSGYQEQTGHYGAIVIDPKDAEPFTYDRDYVVLLSDWSDTVPERIYANLKKMSDFYNFRERTVGDWWRDVQNKGWAQTQRDRAMWNRQRMSDTDLSDVTGYTYTYLMNGMTPASGWQGLFRRGERVRLRFINAAAMTLFDVRIPGLKMTVVAADGQNIEPVTVDEFRLGVAETYDVIVEPSADSAYTVFAQSIDRTGYARGTLTPNPSWEAEVPKMDPAPFLTHRDMGMAMGMGHGSHGMASDATDHSQRGMKVMPPMPATDHRGHATGLGKAGHGSNTAIAHVQSEYGPHVDMRADTPMNGISDPGVGLRDHLKANGRRVLTYGDLGNLHTTEDQREPEREIQLHLTGNMSRYMWSVNGIKYADAEPIALTYGERLRITLVNDTMMTHPMHLHGMWGELETGDPKHLPRKHTVMVQPGSKVSYLVTADAMGRWAYHCHLLYHMGGMFREVKVS